MRMKCKLFVISLIILIMVACKKEKVQTYDKMEWWKDARFGLFIHWGIYSVPAGTYQGRKIPNIGEWIMNQAKIPVNEYAKYAEKFNPVDFNAEEWVKLAKDAGMKYIIITSKHHDGFAMFHSKVSTYNIYDATPFKRDPLDELARACKKYNMRLGFYYSQAQDWHHAGGAAIGGHWDSLQNGDMDKYIDEVAVPQVREILSNYGEISVLWWDTPEDMTKDRAEKFLPLLDLQPGIIYNNRLGGSFKGDLETPEQHIPETSIPGKNWESCMTMNDTWGYKSYDQNWKSTKKLIFNLIDIASKGGNYLLNVGPTSLGRIPDSSIKRLKEVGKWMSVNGESIYGTSASPFKNLQWGKCTQKLQENSTTLYFHIINFPENQELLISGLDNKVQKIYALADQKKSELPFIRKGANIIIDISTVKKDRYATVVVMEIQGKPVVSEPPVISCSTKIFSDSLQIWLSTDIVGSEIRYTLDGSDPFVQSPVYTQEIKLLPENDVTIHAAVFKAGKQVSGSAVKTFFKVLPEPAVWLKNENSGLKYSYYEGVWDGLPDFSRMKPIKSGITKSIDISKKGKPFNYGLEFSGYVKIPVNGVYTFYLESDDGSKMTIDDSYIIDNNGTHPMVEKSVEVPLAKGFHKINISFFQQGGGDGLNVSLKGPGIEKQIIGETFYFHE
jgi:alpha-L-fucosidase